MRLLKRLLGLGPKLSADAAARLAAWQARPPVDNALPLTESSCVVVDVETSGLDLVKDRLIAIGAVRVNRGRIDLGDSFEIVLQQDSVSTKENILIHGIGGTAQVDGVPPVEALLAFLEYLGKDPLVAFHVTFDQTMIRRALGDHLGLDFRHPWLDLAYVSPALHPELARRYRALDDWISHYDIQNFARHSALADALATANLLQVELSHAREKSLFSHRQLQDLEKAQRWISWAN